ncbi:hypothetical protein VNO77_31387 [Canavalia gladiata]|uniref:Uncharacterized protein n=1 Tax=Canavalia gladiata TaxID=3824 RepID=A0AAN9Q3Y5_CANGL
MATPNATNEGPRTKARIEIPKTRVELQGFQRRRRCMEHQQHNIPPLAWQHFKRIEKKWIEIEQIGESEEGLSLVSSPFQKGNRTRARRRVLCRSFL